MEGIPENKVVVRMLENTRKEGKHLLKMNPDLRKIFDWQV